VVVAGLIPCVVIVQANWSRRPEWLVLVGWPVLRRPRRPGPGL